MSKQKRLINSYKNDFDFSKKSKAMKDLDPDLLEYFNDFQPVRKKSNSKLKKSRFSIGDQVCVKDTFGTIIFGPYKSASNNDTYEIETEDNQFITVEDDGHSISSYVSPEEEIEEDDLF